MGAAEALSVVAGNGEESAICHQPATRLTDSREEASGVVFGICSVILHPTFDFFLRVRASFAGAPRDSGELERARLSAGIKVTPRIHSLCVNPNFLGNTMGTSRRRNKRAIDLLGRRGPR